MTTSSMVIGIDKCWKTPDGIQIKIINEAEWPPFYLPKKKLVLKTLFTTVKKKLFTNESIYLNSSHLHTHVIIYVCLNVY